MILVSEKIDLGVNELKAFRIEMLICGYEVSRNKFKIQGLGNNLLFISGLDEPKDWLNILLKLDRLEKPHRRDISSIVRERSLNSAQDRSILKRLRKF